MRRAHFLNAMTAGLAAHGASTFQVSLSLRLLLRGPSAGPGPGYCRPHALGRRLERPRRSTPGLHSRCASLTGNDSSPYRSHSCDPVRIRRKSSLCWLSCRNNAARRVFPEARWVARCARVRRNSQRVGFRRSTIDRYVPHAESPRGPAQSWIRKRRSACSCECSVFDLGRIHSHDLDLVGLSLVPGLSHSLRLSACRTCVPRAAPAPARRNLPCDPPRSVALARISRSRSGLKRPVIAMLAHLCSSRRLASVPVAGST